MKIIAIILSVALFFTIVTSNAVSIASVVFLAKGETAQQGTVGGDATNPDASTDAGTDAGTVTPDAGTDAGTVTPDAGTDAGTVTPDAGTDAGTVTPDAGTSDSGSSNAGTSDSGSSNAGTDANKPATDTNKPATDTNKPAADTNKPAADANKPAADTTKPAADTNKPAADANKPAADANKPAADANKPAADANKPATPQATQPAAPAGGVDQAALSMFQKAAKEINTKGVAGYSYKSWQAIESIDVGGNDKIKGLIEGFLTKEEDAEVKVQEKGTEDAMRRMPASNCSASTVASATKKASGSNVIVTIVMKDVTNPAKTDTDGLNVMSRDFLYMEDVHETVKTNTAVKLLVKSLDKGEITYKAYTITATMTSDGKFIEITHKCSAQLIADAQLIVGSLNGSGVLQFNVRYWDFKY